MMENGACRRIHVRAGKPASWWRLAAAGLALMAVACGGPSPQEPPASTGAPSATAKYELKGRVVAIDRAGKRLTVDHEAIPGFMGAMTMAYPVRGEHGLEGLAAGDQVTAKVVSSEGSYWLEEVAIVSHGGLPPK